MADKKKSKSWRARQKQLELAKRIFVADDTQVDDNYPPPRLTKGCLGISLETILSDIDPPLQPEQLIQIKRMLHAQA